MILAFILAVQFQFQKKSAVNCNMNTNRYWNMVTLHYILKKKIKSENEFVDWVPTTPVPLPNVKGDK